MATPKPLKILVSPLLVGKPAIRALTEKGHIVETMDVAVDDFDMILSPRAWRMLEAFADSSSLVEDSVKAARAIKYRRKQKETEDE